MNFNKLVKILEIWPNEFFRNWNSIEQPTSDFKALNVKKDFRNIANGKNVNKLSIPV